MAASFAAQKIQLNPLPNGMVDNGAVARSYFNFLDPTVVRELHVGSEPDKVDLPLGGDYVVDGKFDDQVRLANFPIVSEGERLRCIGAIAFRGSLIDPGRSRNSKLLSSRQFCGTFCEW